MQSGPQEWLYRASNAKEGRDSTLEFVQKFGFIQRNPYVDAEKGQLVPNVKEVDLGHIIHLYFVDSRGGQQLGCFRVVGPGNHPNGKQFGAAVKGAFTLRSVAESELLDHLIAAEGYERDPKLATYCGWPVVQEERPSPRYLPGLFSGRNSLVEYPRQRSARRSSAAAR